MARVFKSLVALANLGRAGLQGDVGRKTEVLSRERCQQATTQGSSFSFYAFCYYEFSSNQVNSLIEEIYLAYKLLGSPFAQRCTKTKVIDPSCYIICFPA